MIQLDYLRSNCNCPLWDGVSTLFHRLTQWLVSDIILIPGHCVSFLCLASALSLTLGSLDFPHVLIEPVSFFNLLKALTTCAHLSICIYLSTLTVMQKCCGSVCKCPLADVSRDISKQIYLVHLTSTLYFVPAQFAYT